VSVCAKDATDRPMLTNRLSQNRFRKGGKGLLYIGIASVFIG
jgi:hypothetical protein